MPDEMNTEGRLGELERETQLLKAAIQELCQHASGWHPIPFQHSPALDEICRSRWPNLGGTPSLPRHETATHPQAPERRAK